MGNTSFDVYDNIPEEMRTYLQNYGFNFSEKMCDWAISMMKTKEGKITPITKDQVTAMLKKYNITLERIMVIIVCMLQIWQRLITLGKVFQMSNTLQPLSAIILMTQIILQRRKLSVISSQT